MVASQQPNVSQTSKDIATMLCSAPKAAASHLPDTIDHLCSLLALPAVGQVEVPAGKGTLCSGKMNAHPSCLRAFDEVDELLAESFQDHIAVPCIDCGYLLKAVDRQESWILYLRCESCALGTTCRNTSFKVSMKKNRY